MGLGNNLSLLGKLRRAVKKIKILLNYSFNIRWKMASIVGRSRKVLSFNDRQGLSLFIDDEPPNNSDSNDSGDYQRSRSSPLLLSTSSFSSEEDIDKRAELFITNFHKQLRLERQISLELRYARGQSFGSSSSVSPRINGL